MPPARTGVATTPAIFPLAPRFRGARSSVLQPGESTAPSALSVRRVTVIASLEADMSPRQLLLDGGVGTAPPAAFFTIEVKSYP